MAIAFNLSAVFFDTNPNAFDCVSCQANKVPGFRKVMGCRLLDKDATSRAPFSALEEAYTVDHCPGIYVSSPFIGSLWELQISVEAGIGLDNYFTTPLPNPVVESIKAFHSIKNRTIRLKREEEAKKEGAS